jgi:hypothetical protein
MDKVKSIKIAIKDARIWTGKEIVPNPESLYITEHLLPTFDLQDNVDVSCSMVDIDFWRTNEDIKMGPAGYVGACRGYNCACRICTPKPFTLESEDNYMLTIKWRLENDPSSLIHKFTNDKFRLTKGPRGNFITPISCQNGNLTKTVKYAICPKPETVEALKILQKVNPNMTLNDMIITNHSETSPDSKYNTLYINKVEISSITPSKTLENALEFFNETVPDTTKCYHEVIYQMMACDLSKNMSIFKYFLMELSKFVNNNTNTNVNMNLIVPSDEKLSKDFNCWKKYACDLMEKVNKLEHAMVVEKEFELYVTPLNLSKVFNYEAVKFNSRNKSKSYEYDYDGVIISMYETWTWVVDSYQFEDYGSITVNGKQVHSYKN